MQRVEARGGEDWIVRVVSGATAQKAYRCPGCSQEIPSGVGHVVAWPAEPLAGFGGVSDRRHWHNGCWRGGRMGR
jgi:hypothetical protein